LRNDKSDFIIWKVIALIKYSEIENEKDRVFTYLTQERQVKYLFHFTPNVNLAGIAERGIVPRNQLTNDYQVIIPDENRADNQLDCSCFSLSYPNYKMLYKLEAIPGKGPFAILVINIQALWDDEKIGADDIFFFEKNAASTLMNMEPRELHTGMGSALLMFELEQEKRSKDLCLWHTTNPQAEVLVHGVIPPNSIEKIFLNPKKRAEYGAQPEAFKPIILWSPSFFMPRCDWKNWQHEK